MTIPHYLQVALQHGSHLLSHYGYIALFVLLAVGIVGLPIPDETLMVAAGILVAKGKLSMPLTVIIALCGSICGITMSYFIGHAAEDLIIKKYGSWIGITEARLAKAHQWFEKLGVWILFFGYFIPGVRHLTGYIAGAVNLKYKKFALFAYLGAIFWASTFLIAGYLIAHHLLFS